MKNKELYDRTVSILVDAYMNDTLKHGSCYACAVGNIIAANMGIEYQHKQYWSGYDFPSWDNVFSTISSTKQQFISPINYSGDAKKQIDSTGYSWQDLAKIEFAFEAASREGDRMFNGLMAVIEVLDILHENTDTTITTSSKQRFTKQLI